MENFTQQRVTQTLEFDFPKLIRIDKKKCSQNSACRAIKFTKIFITFWKTISFHGAVKITESFNSYSYPKTFMVFNRTPFSGFCVCFISFRNCQYIMYELMSICSCGSDSKCFFYVFARD